MDVANFLQSLSQRLSYICHQAGRSSVTLFRRPVTENSTHEVGTAAQPPLLMWGKLRAQHADKMLTLE